MGEIILKIYKMCYKNTHIKITHTLTHTHRLTHSHLHKNLVGWLLGWLDGWFIVCISRKSVWNGRASVTNLPASTGISSLQNSPVHVRAYGKPLFPNSEEHIVHWVSPSL